MINNPKRLAILKTAIRCIAQNGLENTTADVIAKKMGIAQSGIFYYYPTLDQLFDSLDAHIAETNHHTVVKYLEENPPKTAWETLAAHFRGNLHWGNKNPDHVAVLLHSMAKSGHNRHVRERVNKLFLIGEARVEEILKEGIQKKEFKKVKDVPKLAVFVHKALMGIIISAYYSKHLRDVKYYEEILLGQIEQLVRD